METTLESKSKTARLAASLFVFVCVPLSLWSESYIPQRIFVNQDPVATANNLLSNESIFRVAMATHLVSFFFFILMVLLFYRLLKPVDKHLSRLMVVPVLGQIPIVFGLELLNFTALMILKTEPRPTFDVVHQQEVAYFLLRLEKYGAGATKIYFGLCLIPMGILVFRSRFAPRIIGILMIIGGVAYVADTCIYFLLQRADFLIVRSFLKFTYPSYMLSLLWFLVMGVREQRAPTGVVN